MDDGESCVASDCGPLEALNSFFIAFSCGLVEDPLGKWSGSHSYLGVRHLELLAS